MSSNPTLDRLIDCFASLPGVGRKSAARLAYHVLDMSDEEAFDFADAIRESKTRLHECPICHN